MVILPLLLAALQDGVYQTLDPEPTAEEVMVLELINRFRADPKGEAERVLSAGAEIPNGVDRGMFVKEMEALKPTPPLVFNLKLLEAARKHSHYMILNLLTHSENPQAKGFTGIRPWDRTAKAGYPGQTVGENCYRDAGSVLESHVGYVIDWGSDDGGARGGMQSRRGHRSNMHSAEFREIGAASLPHGGKVSVTHDLADRRGPARLAGGVVFHDLNANGRYDPGEGRGGITISTPDGSASTTTWASGAYALELKNADAVTLKAVAGTASSERAFEAGSANLKFDWIIPNEALVKAVEKLLADAEKIEETPENERQRFAARVALYQGTRGIPLQTLDEETQKRAAALLEGMAEKVEPPLEAVRAAIKKGDLKLVDKAIAEAKKTLRATPLEEWLADADAFGEVMRLIEAVHKKKGTIVPKSDAAAAGKELEKRAKKFKTPEWKGIVRARIDQLTSTGR